MEDKEIKFWVKVDKLPNNMEQDEWEVIVTDYHERLRLAKIDGVKYEKDSLDDIIKHLEIHELENIIKIGELPMDIFVFSDIADDDSGLLISRKWNEPLCHSSELFKYSDEAKKRYEYYQLLNINDDNNKYEQYLDYLAEQKFITGDTMTIIIDENDESAG
jgi:hypothetical protein